MADVPKQPATASPAGDLVLRCLELLEREGPDAVEALLASHASAAEDARARLRRLAQRGFAPLYPRSSGPDVPERLGPFRLIERLGVGGMGIVYLAWDEILSRRVALKVVRPDLLPMENARERFRREVEAVARLKHPGILPVYSSGEESGVPFFTMEYVEGCTLSVVLSHLADRRPAELSGAVLSAAVAARSPRGSAPSGQRASPGFGTTWTEACFRLVLTVAEALHHAHERGVLHRDVKPSNIMVMPDGRAVLVDFGVAAMAEASHITMSGSHVGSLPYMPPEHLRGERAGEKGDVYSLGVTLYELLTLRCPYLAPQVEVMRTRILEGVPQRIRSLNPEIPWDAETVCLTAMERDPARRYASAAALAEDLANFLEHRPIRARPPGPLLRSRRFVERHPVVSVATALGSLLLVGAAALAALQVSANRRLRAANRDKDAALTEARTALLRKDEINEILRSMIGAPDPWRSEPIDPVSRDTKVVDVLDHARAALEERELDPAVEQEVGSLLGRTYANLGLFERAEPLLLRARDLARALHGERSRESIEVATQLGGLYYDQTRHAEAISILEAALASCEELLAPDDRLTTDALNNLALCEHDSGNLDRAEELYRRMLASCPEVGGRASRERALARALACNNLGSLLQNRHRLDEAEPLIEEALELRQRHYPPGHPRILATRNELGLLRLSQGRFAEGASILEQTLADGERVLGADDMKTLIMRVNFAWACVETGRFARAEEDARRVLELEGAVYPEGHPLGQMARIRLAQSLLGQGELVEAAERSAEAERLFVGVTEPYRQTATELRRRILEALPQAEARLVGELDAAHAEHGAVHAETHAKVLELAAVWRALGKQEDARFLLEEVLAEWKRPFPDGGVEVTALEQELERCRQAAPAKE